MGLLMDINGQDCMQIKIDSSKTKQLSNVYFLFFRFFVLWAKVLGTSIKDIFLTNLVLIKDERVWNMFVITPVT